jgi:hypothetical protein
LKEDVIALASKKPPNSNDTTSLVFRPIAWFELINIDARPDYSHIRVAVELLRSRFSGDGVRSENCPVS